MKSISLKVEDQILDDTDRLLRRLKISRNKYTNEAIDFYNHYQKRKFLAEQLALESKLVAEDSMNVLKEFESLNDEM